jgi:protocatechuate 3,4-dioxygenase beta subunit
MADSASAQERRGTPTGRRTHMTDRSKSPSQLPATTSRRTFVGAVGAVMLGCASDDGGSAADEAGGPEQTTGRNVPEGNTGTPADPGAPTPPEPMGTAAEAGDQPAQPTNLQNEPAPGGGGNGTPANGPNQPSTPPAANTPGTCTLYPQQTEGPYYVDGEMLRADLREDRQGTLLVLDLLVLSADGCTPLANAAVDIWHCDAAGVYSGFQNQLGGLNTTGQIFLRGTQLTGPDGRVQFTTIYPGWYPGRTTHIHFKVHLGTTREVTSQLYFPEALNSEVYGTDPYAAHGQKDTSNMADGFAGSAPLLAVTSTLMGYAASMAITVAS